jgi:hypothetical protein
MRRASTRADMPIQEAMTLNVQGAAATPWPDPTILAAALPQPALHPTTLAPARADRHEERRVEAPAATRPYDSMRLQAYRRDAAETAALGTQSAPTTGTASTASAPAVKVAPPAQVNPLASAPEAPFRTPPPQAPPPVQAPAAVDEQAGARGR